MFKNRRLKKYIKLKYNVKIGHWHRKFWFILDGKYKHIVFANLENMVKFLEKEEQKNEKEI